MPKPASISASMLLNARPPIQSSIGTAQRGADGKHVDLNFKVPAPFKRAFKQLALDAGDISQVELLSRMVEAYKREQGIS